MSLRESRRGSIFLYTLVIYPGPIVSVGDHDRALDRARAMVHLRPAHADTHYRLAVCLGYMNCIEEARAALAECERLRPGFIQQRADWRPYPDPASNHRFLPVYAVVV